MIDGICDAWPVSTMHEHYEARMLEPCYLSISVAAVAGSTESSGTLVVSLVSETGLDTDATLNVMLTESGVPGSGTFESQPYNYGLRDNLCSHDGLSVLFGSSPESIEIDVDYTIDPTWVWDQLYITAFVQSTATDEVLNSCMFRMCNIPCTEPDALN